jgi:phage shock protein B
MKMLEFLFVPTILFLAVVAPVWIIMHYKSARQSSRSLNQGDLKMLEALLVDVDKMADRIEALESILDQDVPQWRRQYEQSDTGPGEATQETRQ